MITRYAPALLRTRYVQEQNVTASRAFRETLTHAGYPLLMRQLLRLRKAVFAGMTIIAAHLPLVAADALNIRVVDGQGAINNMRTRYARAPVIELRDDQDRPVSGASVTFQTPFAGPSGTFGAVRLLVTQTDSEGRATGRGLVPNSVAGPFEIHVSATFDSKVANATIRQINASPSESRSSKKLLWISLVVGAAAGGAMAATHGHGGAGSSSVPTVPSTAGLGLVAGTSSFGPPPQ